MKLRDYQTKAVANTRDAMAAGSRATLLVLPTGGGKTVIFTYLASHVSKRAKRVLILVHRIELIRQTCAALDRFGVAYGVINPNFTPDDFAPVQVASIQSMAARLHRVRRDFDLVIVDEAHHATAESWRFVLNAMPTKCRILGVTATPCRGDETGLGVESGGLFDTMVEGPQIDDLIQMGFLVEPVVYAPTSHLDMTALRKLKDTEKGKMERIMADVEITGDAIEHYRRHADGLPAVAFCVSVRHAQLVAEQFRAAGYRSEFVDGAMDDMTRKRTLDGLADGSMQVVTSCDLISEGFDLPAISCAILLRQTKSLGLYLQQVGRALRPVPGKGSAIILDHAGNSLLHGLPDERRTWTLDGVAAKKGGAESDTIKAPRIIQCERCYHVYIPVTPACPSCGHVKAVKAPPKHAEGELRRLTAEEKAALAELRKKEAKAKRMEVGSARSIADLKAIAQARGYKPGWVWQQAQIKDIKQ